MHEWSRINEFAPSAGVIIDCRRASSLVLNEFRPSLHRIDCNRLIDISVSPPTTAIGPGSGVRPSLTISSGVASKRSLTEFDLRFRGRLRALLRRRRFRAAFISPTGELVAAAWRLRRVCSVALRVRAADGGSDGGGFASNYGDLLPVWQRLQQQQLRRPPSRKQQYDILLSVNKLNRRGR
jgi:hypothetical protein